MSAHTKGPWSCGDIRKDAEYINVWMGIVHIAAVCNTYKDDEAEANARLIAAAPELLEALKGMFHGTGALPIDDPDSHGSPKIKFALAVIAKATGKESA